MLKSFQIVFAWFERGCEQRGKQTVSPLAEGYVRLRFLDQYRRFKKCVLGTSFSCSTPWSKKVLLSNFGLSHGPICSTYGEKYGAKTS